MAKGRKLDDTPAKNSNSDEEEEGSPEENEDQAEPESESGKEEEEEEDEEEEEEEDGGDDEEDEEEDQGEASPPAPEVTKTPGVTKKSGTAKAQSKPQAPSSSSDESEPESRPKNTRKGYLNVKPIATKPMDDPNSPAQKSRSKRGLPTARSSAGAKRAKVKANSDNVESEKKDDSRRKNNRVWSDEDEIVILKGMIDYISQKGSDPMTEMNQFHEFIKESLHIDASKTQLHDKVRRMKQKHDAMATAEAKGQKTISSLSGHQEKTYELSKKIWGEMFNNLKPNGTTTSHRKRQAKTPDSSRKINIVSPAKEVKEPAINPPVEKNDGSDQIPPSKPEIDLGLEPGIIRSCLDLISGPKKTELMENLKKKKVQEMELYMKRLEVMQEQAKMVMEALKQ